MESDSFYIFKWFISLVRFYYTKFYRLSLGLITKSKVKLLLNSARKDRNYSPIRSNISDIIRGDPWSKY
jgi:hypothetical protein